MILLLTQVVQTPGAWLWLAATAIAVVLLGSAAGRRRASLIESLREFVRGSKGDAAETDDVEASDAEDTDAAN